MPRETSECDDAASDRIATAASCPWNLSTVPTRTSVEAGVVEGAAQLADLAVVGRDDDDVGGAQRSRPDRRAVGAALLRVVPGAAEQVVDEVADDRGLLGRPRRVVVVVDEAHVQPGLDPVELPRGGDRRLRVQLAGVGQPRDGRGQRRVHAPGASRGSSRARPAAPARRRSTSRARTRRRGRGGCPATPAAAAGGRRAAAAGHRPPSRRGSSRGRTAPPRRRRRGRADRGRPAWCW